MNPTRGNASARERILQTAERLFYAEGVRGVGIDRVIAEAGVAKMTLYHHFKSKDALILEVLKHRDAAILASFRSQIGEAERSGRDPLDAFFDALEAWFRSPGFRGCAFLNTAIELADRTHPASRFVCEHVAAFQDLLADVVRRTAGTGTEPDAAGVGILVEGAIVMALVQGRPEVAGEARRAARALVSGARGVAT